MLASFFSLYSCSYIEQ